MLEKELAIMILEELRREFDTVRLSGNLVNTIKVYPEGDKWKIEIPAQMYDILKYKKDKVIIYTNQGSYASAVDETGGFSGKHKNYVDNCIQRAIQRWMKDNQIEGKVR